MPVAFPAIKDTATASQASGSSSTNFTFTGTTAGRGLVFCVRGAAGSGLTITGATCSGETVIALGSSVSGNDVAARWFAIAALQSGGDKVVNVTYTNGTNAADIGAVALEVTGHDTASIVPTVSALDTTNPTAFTITTANANSAVVIMVHGGMSEPGSASGYTAYDTNNAYNRSYLLYDEDVGAAGVKNVSPSQGWWSLGIEVKAASGAALAGQATGSGQAAAAASITKTLAGAAAGSGTAVGNLSVSSSVVFRTTLVDYETGLPVANWTGLTWYWAPTLADILAGTNIQGGTGESTDANGQFEAAASSGLTPGLDQGFFIITDFNGANAETARWVSGQFDIVTA